MAKDKGTAVAVVDKSTLPSRTAAPAMPPTVPGNRAITIVPPSEIETFDVDVVESSGAKVERDSRSLPIIRVLQSNSPQVKEPEDGGIPGAREGSLYNTVTQEVFEGRENGLFLIPVRKNHMIIEYVKRESDGSGGGFLNAYEPENPIVKAAWDARREELAIDPTRPIFGKVPNGVVEEDGPNKGKVKELVDTWYIDGICVVPNEDGSFPGHFGMFFQASIAFQSSFIPTFNSWDEKRRNQKYSVRGKMVEPAMWTTVWKLRTVTKPKGNLKWKVPSLTLGMIDPESGLELDYKDCRLPRKFDDGSDNPLYLAAVDLNVELLEGSVRLDLAADKVDAEGTGERYQGSGEDDSNNIPFDKM